MNVAVWTLYREYLDKTGHESVAASLTLADVMQQGLDAGAPAPPAALTAIEAASRLRVNRETIYRLSRSGKLRGCRVGGALRFPLDEIERFEKEGGAAQPRQATPPNIFKRHTINRRLR